MLEQGNAAALEGLFASNSRTNKTLWNSGKRTPLEVSPVSPFLEVGDILTYYICAKWRWAVTSQSKNFTILEGEDNEGKFINTIIDWRNGWRTHNDWNLLAKTDGRRASILEALESGEWKLGGPHDWHLDIETVRRDGKLIVRRAQKILDAE